MKARSCCSFAHPFLILGLGVAVLFFTGCGTDSTATTDGSRQRPAANHENLSAAAAFEKDTLDKPKAASAEAAQTGHVFSTDELIGKIDPARHPDFVSVGKPYTDRSGMMLRREAFEAFRDLWEAAQAEGITLKIISSTRTFAQQKAIWEGKWARFAAATPDPQARALKILEYSSMPGSSRHHWGTDIDLNDLNNAAFEAGGRYAPAYVWLQKNASRFGFCQPYTPLGDARPRGYHEEKWHWSYQPLSSVLLRQYAVQMQDSLITGFQGAETAGPIGIVRHYVLGVAAPCR